MRSPGQGRTRCASWAPSWSRATSPTTRRDPRGVEGADAVFHVGAIYKVGIPKKERAAMLDANVRGTERVLDAAIEAGVPRIVYVSTVQRVRQHRRRGGGRELPPRRVARASSPTTTRRSSARARGGRGPHRQGRPDRDRAARRRVRARRPLRGRQHDRAGQHRQAAGQGLPGHGDHAVSTSRTSPTASCWPTTRARSASPTCCRASKTTMGELVDRVGRDRRPQAAPVDDAHADDQGLARRWAR